MRGTTSKSVRFADDEKEKRKQKSRRGRNGRELANELGRPEGGGDSWQTVLADR